MKFVILLVVASIAMCLGEDKYSDEYDSVDLDEVLNNKRLYANYISCILGKGKCSADAKYLKETIPDALQTGCTKCSEVQKKRVGKMLKFVKENHSDDYSSLLEKYDPEGQYKDLYKDLVA
uniref:Chemosensory protein 10 n=1 Tax=Cyrtorhinus lividipennis TaxID=1032904 RepID=A0A346TI06_9HEMI|nr:chemosensory protein 10 [Cyrtorhinus lividipennis]